jgi:hypothetical protein
LEVFKVLMTTPTELATDREDSAGGALAEAWWVVEGEP